MKQKQKDVVMNFEKMHESEMIQFLTETNKKTENWSNIIFGKKTSKLLQLIWLKPNEIKSLIPDNKISEWENDYQQIKQVFEIEKIMFEKYKKFIVFAVKKATKKIKSYYLNSDFVNESYIVFKKCVWFYSNSNFKFSTYLFKAIASMIHHIVFKRKNSRLKINYQSDSLCISNATKEVENDFSENLDSQNFDLEKIINNIGLDEKEKLALRLRYKFDRKWVVEARKQILKSDGTAYSKFGLRIILSKALEKIKERYFEKSFNLAS